MLSPAGFETFAGFLKARSGLAIGPDKMYLLESRLEPLLRHHGLRDLQAMADKLRTGAEPLGSAVVEAMTTNESFFFREERAFSHLAERAVPRLRAARGAGTKLRIWSAACSTGQEAYSVAMQLAGQPIEILGTDIAEQPLARAREGIYTQFEVQRGLPIRQLTQHFKKDQSQWRISDSLRGQAQFRRFNLLDDGGALGRFDVIFCRNVLIYFDQATKSRVLAMVANRLAPDGVVYLGGAETVLGLTTKLVPAPDANGACAYVVG